MSCSVTDPRLAFHATYFDSASHITKQFLCLFYHGDQTVELIDATSTKTFLKRSKCPNLTKEQFFLGAEIVVFGRVLNLVKYADRVTEQLCERLSEAVVAVISDPLFPKLGDCLDIVTQECSFGICSMHTVELKNTHWNSNDGAKLLPRSFANKNALVLVLVRDGALRKAATLPDRFENSGAVWVASDRTEVEQAQALIDIAYHKPSAVMAGPSSVVLVKPHILIDKRGGEVLQHLLNAGLRLTALTQTTLSTEKADMFLQPYKGVLKDYRPAVEQIAAGALWAAQFVTRDESDPVAAVRELVGPFDPVIAKVLRPKTIRARMGKDAVRNVVHCSDLDDDGPADAAFFW